MTFKKNVQSTKKKGFNSNPKAQKNQNDKKRKKMSSDEEEDDDKEIGTRKSFSNIDKDSDNDDDFSSDDNSNKKNKKERALTLEERSNLEHLFEQGENPNRDILPDEDLISDESENEFFTNNAFLNTDIEKSSFKKVSLTKQLEDEKQKKRNKLLNGNDNDGDDNESDEEVTRSASNWNQENIVKRKLPIKTTDGKVKKITEIITAQEYTKELEKQEEYRVQLKETVTKEREKKDRKKKPQLQQPTLKEIEKQQQQKPSKKQKFDRDDDEDDSESEESEIDEDEEMSDIEIKEDEEIVQDQPTSDGQKFLKSQEMIERIKQELAKICNSIINNPENNITKIKEIFSICLSKKEFLVKKYCILSLCALFKDIIPGYTINKSLQDGDSSVTDGEGKQVKLSKDAKKIREYEVKLLKYYQNYLILIENSIAMILTLLKNQVPDSKNNQAAFFKYNQNTRLTRLDLNTMLQCILKSVCSLLVAHPHFNFRTNLVTITCRFTVYREKELSMLCLQSIKELFQTDQTGGECSLEVVRTLSNVAKVAGYMIDPKVLRVFMAIQLTNVVEKINPFGKATDEIGDNDPMIKKIKKRMEKKSEKHQSKNERKSKKKEKELEKELKEADAEYTEKEQRYLQTEILKSIFIIYFRIIKQAPQSPALSAVLEGLAKFSHLISVDFLGDLLKVLSKLMENGITSISNALNTSISAFKTLKTHGNTLNVDLKDYYQKVYSLLTQLVLPDQFEVVLTTINALSLMFADRKQTAMERVAAFIKRVSTVSLYLPPHASLALVALCKQLFVGFPRTQRLLEIDHTHAYGDYLPESLDPDHCNPFSTTLWELTLYNTHWHPKFEMVKRVLSFNDTLKNQVQREKSPMELYKLFDSTGGGFNPPIQVPKEHHLEQKLKKLEKSFKNKEVYVLPQQSREYHNDGKSPFLKSLHKQIGEQVTDSISFAPYFLENKEFESQFKLTKKLQKLNSIKDKIKILKPALEQKRLKLESLKKQQHQQSQSQPKPKLSVVASKKKK
ncbi:hypothetical protein DLAC_08378 [Tieghemostelium lacteum]|uniref:Nucleolar complex protein 3 homolog n=1 Tax=Tieghemostelium lacteum TaxID=361077 RepID=A0A151ZBT8_TIELA|nr:hypothetical protein DLAC_08378 [Tieghemostelium lacteum]|eukprot:KYQ91413.1 hypothetical protein DLAC_08378 [Tieghemostelium lacteum]